MYRLPSPTVALLLLVAGCGDNSNSRPAARPEPKPEVTAAAADAAAPVAALARCDAQEFANSLPIPEASGAAWLASGAVLVVSDSGNGGAALEMRGDTGEVVWSGKLPLDPVASDDVEGLARVGDLVYGITSSGYVRSWRRADDGWRAVDRAYPVEPSSPDGLTCAPLETNCGHNIEGLCLRDPAPGDGCAGFVAGKRDGRLYCLVWDDGRLRADRARSIDVTAGRMISGCSYTPEGRLLVATNLFGGNAIYEIRDHEHPERARAELVTRTGAGFVEAIAAAPEGVLYRFSDTSQAPSGVEKLVCR